MRLLITTEPRNGYEAGHILAVRRDDAPFGRAEDIDRWVAAGRDPAAFPSPWFAIVDIEGEPVDLNLAEPEMVGDPGEDGATVTVRKRAWRVDLDALRPRERAAVDAPGGKLRITAARARQVIRHRTGASMPLRLPGDTGERRAATDERARVDRARLRPTRG